MQDTYTVMTSASPETIWSIWSDVKNWPRWEPALKSASIKGGFSTDAEGLITADNWPPTQFKITSCQDRFSYTLNTKLPFATMHIRRLIGYNNMKTMITNEVWMEGPLGGFWWRIIGRRYKSMLPQVMERFKRIAEA
jgi:hypothetical protein